ncbi:MAG: phosphoadenosine phosphosulfate reductase family protein [Clostridia bacterium]|nr:phosphoadenosine phosphosulfate reductase family protein [Clostridia bacterium]
MPEKWVLQQYQALPLRAKITMTQARIREWYNHWQGGVFVSFSGGKDSTALAHLVHEICPDVPLVFSNTGLEYPEIQEFARRMGAEFVRPKMQFSEVISTYGYPIISKENAQAIYYARRIKNGAGHFSTTDRKRVEFEGLRPESNESYRRGLLLGGNGNFDAYATGKEKKSFYNKEKWLPLCRDTQFKISHYCCAVMKKAPLEAYQRKHKAYPIIGTLTEESRLREQAWIKNGCNAFEGRHRTSQPMSFWTEQDVLKYLYWEGFELASVYGEIVGIDSDGKEYFPMPGVDCKLKCTGCQRTGCVFCGFGCHLEKGETRFQRLAKTHPRQYEYCMGGGQWADNPDYDPSAPKMDGRWENWNPKKIWVPSKEGLGMKHVFDECNQIYGKNFIRYE